MRLRADAVAAVAFATFLVGCVETEQPAESVNAQSVLRDCTGLEPLNASDPIVPEKELLIRDLSVVEDPCRTNWATAGCSTSTNGKWTFGWLMTVMSGATDINSSTARSFVANWLAFWLTPQTVSVSELFEGVAVSLFEGVPRSRSRALLGRAGMGSGNQRAMT